MLPFWLRSDVQSTFREVGGLSLGQKSEALFARRLHAINSDAMCYARGPLEEEPTKNRVILGGETRPVTEYIEPLCRGFAEGYRFVIRRRRAILDEWLPQFAGLPVRYLFRPTVVYFWLLRDSLSPELLRCGTSFSLNLEKLARAYLGGPAAPPAWPLLDAEREQLCGLDIPFFGTACDRRDLHRGVSEPVRDFLVATGLEESRWIIERLSEEDLAFQCDMIRGTLRAAGQMRAHTEAQNDVVFSDAATPPAPPRDEGQAPLDQALLAREIEHVHEILVQTALDAPDGSLDWLAIRMDPRSEHFDFGSVGDDLYNGRAGIALFFAAADHVKKVRANRETVERIIDPLVKDAEKHLQGVSGSGSCLRMGGLAGLGGIITAFHHLGRFYAEERFAKLAYALAETVTEEALARHDESDVLNGAAGTLLALSALHAGAPETRLLERARLCLQLHPRAAGARARGRSGLGRHGTLSSDGFGARRRRRCHGSGTVFSSSPAMSPAELPQSEHCSTNARCSTPPLQTGRIIGGTTRTATTVDPRRSRTGGAPAHRESR